LSASYEKTYTLQSLKSNKLTGPAGVIHAFVQFYASAGFKSGKGHADLKVNLKVCASPTVQHSQFTIPF